MVCVTKYQKLQTALKAELSSGRFQVGDRFYTERQIMQKYRVSGITVARALSEMTEQGYFERKRKLGTFVKESPEMPGMSGCLMTRPLYINRSFGEDLGEPQSGISWFVVEEIRRGIINTYPGSVKIVDMDSIMEESARHPDLLAVLIPQHIGNYTEKYSHCCPSNTIEIALPPYQCRPVNAVRPNYLVGVYEAMEHLIQLGHTRIATLFKHDHMRGFTRETYPEFLKACGIGSSIELVRYFKRMNQVSQLTRELMFSMNPPTAFMCYCDNSAMRVLETLNELGYQVPEQVSVMGICGYLERLFTVPPLSIVNFHYDLTAQEAVKVMREADQWYGTDRIITRPIPHEIVVKGSTAPCYRMKREDNEYLVNGI